MIILYQNYIDFIYVLFMFYVVFISYLFYVNFIFIIMKLCLFYRSFMLCLYNIYVQNYGIETSVIYRDEN